jgi:hypothetical protein
LVLPDGWELPQGGCDRRGHVTQLPANLLTDSVWLIRGGETGCLGGKRGGAQGVRAHMWDGCGLSDRSGGGRCRGIADLASGAPILKTVADLFRDAKLATGKRSRASDRLSGAAIPRGFRLEQSQHPLRAVRRPSRHDPPIGFAERLRRSHTRSVPRLAAPRPRVPRKAGALRVDALDGDSDAGSEEHRSSRQSQGSGTESPMRPRPRLIRRRFAEAPDTARAPRTRRGMPPRRTGHG